MISCFSRVCKSVNVGETHFPWSTSSTQALFFLIMKWLILSDGICQVSNNMVMQSNFVGWLPWIYKLLLLWVFTCFGDFFFCFRNKILWAVLLISLINWILLKNKVLMLTWKGLGLDFNRFFFSFWWGFVGLVGPFFTFIVVFYGTLHSVLSVPCYKHIIITAGANSLIWQLRNASLNYIYWTEAT